MRNPADDARAQRLTSQTLTRVCQVQGQPVRRERQFHVARRTVRVEIYRCPPIWVHCWNVDEDVSCEFELPSKIFFLCLYVHYLSPNSPPPLPNSGAYFVIRSKSLNALHPNMCTATDLSTLSWPASVAVCTSGTKYVVPHFWNSIDLPVTPARTAAHNGLRRALATFLGLVGLISLVGWCTMCGGACCCLCAALTGSMKVR